MRVVLLLCFALFVSAENYGYEPRPAIIRPPGYSSSSGGMRAALGDKPFYLPPAPSSGLETRGVTPFNITYYGNPNSSVVNAVNYAAAQLAKLYVITTTINVEFHWVSLAPQILGSAGAYQLCPIGSTSTYLPSALTKQTASNCGNPCDCGSTDIYASFNIDQPLWFFGTSGAVTSGHYDLVTVVMHEFTHGMGFSGAIEQCSTGANSTQYDSSFPPSYRMSFDSKIHYTKSGAAVLGNRPGTQGACNAAWYKLICGPDGIYYPLNTYSGFPATNVTLYTPKQWIQGSTMYHMDDTKYAIPDCNSMMVSALYPASAVHYPGPLVLRVLHSLGWTLSSTALNVATNCVNVQGWTPALTSNKRSILTRDDNDQIPEMMEKNSGTTGAGIENAAFATSPQAAVVLLPMIAALYCWLRQSF